jgi:hypothetical protein
MLLQNYNTSELHCDHMSNLYKQQAYLHSTKSVLFLPSLPTHNAMFPFDKKNLGIFNIGQVYKLVVKSDSDLKVCGYSG